MRQGAGREGGTGKNEKKLQYFRMTNDCVSYWRMGVLCVLLVLVLFLLLHKLFTYCAFMFFILGEHRTLKTQSHCACGCTYASLSRI